MEYINFYNTDLKVSRICMGGCPMGGYGWGNVDEDDMIAAIHSALEQGINFFDTAEAYGLGQSELTLAKGLGSHRKDVIIQSKFGVRVMQDNIGQKTIYDNSPDYIEKALDGTLKRLDTDYIDIYTIHYRDKSTDIKVVTDTLKKLKSKGKIRYFGLSNMHGQDIDEISEHKDEFVCCQDEYSLACRDNEEDLKKLSRDYGINALTWGSLGQGVLTGKYNQNSIFSKNDRRSRDIYVNFHGEKFKKNLEIVEAMKPIAKYHEVTLSAVAIRFILDYMEDSVVLVGAKNKRQIEENINGTDWKLEEEEIIKLDNISKEAST